MKQLKCLHYHLKIVDWWDLWYKLGVVQQATFEYSPLGTVFNKGLEKEDEKEGFLKILKNIESKNKEQLKGI